MDSNTLSIPQRAQRMSGFYAQTMKDRGLGCAAHDLTWGLSQLSPPYFDQVDRAMQSLAIGHDDPEWMELLASVRRLCDPQLRQHVQDAGIALDLDTLVGMALHPTGRSSLSPVLAGVYSGQATVRRDSLERLRLLCGSILPRNTLAAPSTELPSANTPLPSQLPRIATPQGLGTELPTPDPAAPGTVAVPRRKAKVFGKSGALTLEIAPVRLREGHSSTARCTVMVEGAQSTGDGHFDWSEGAKIVFMATQKELPQLLAVFMGWTSEVDFRFHGPARNKSLHIVHQDHGLLVHLREDRNNVRVPVEHADCYAPAMLVLAAMAANEPHLDSSAIMAVARAMAVAPEWRRAG